MIDIAHIHPMLIHFPLALIPVALLAQAIALIKGQGLFGRNCLSGSGLALIVLAALGALVAAFFGDIALDKAVESGVPLATMETHEELGITTAILISLLAIIELALFWRQAESRKISLLAFGAGVVVLIVLLTTAAFGGRLVYEQGVNVTTPAIIPSIDNSGNPLP